MSAPTKPETSAAVPDHPPTFDEVYAAHYAGLTVQRGFTLVVDGVPAAATSQTALVEQTRVTAVCGADPVPASATFSYTEAISALVIRLTDADSAIGRAGFAYRLTSDTGDHPLRPGDPRADTSRMVPSDTSGFSLSSIEPDETAGKPGPMPGSYRIVVACGGIGKIEVSVQRPGAATVEFTADCRWPPKLTEFAVGHVDHHAEADLRYVSPAPAPGRLAMAWVPQ